MRTIRRFRLERIPAGGPAPRSRLVADGAPVGPPVEGAVLEGQFDLGDGRSLLVTSDDVPFEETVHLIVLDAAGRVADRYEVGAPYAPGAVENLAAVDGALRFDFAGVGFAVAPVEPRLSLPGGTPAGVRRAAAPWRPVHVRIERAGEGGPGNGGRE